MIIVFGCAAYSVAVSKGKNPYLWFGIGLFLGPFAVLILSFYPSPEKVKSSGTTKKTIPEVE